VMSLLRIVDQGGFEVCLVRDFTYRNTSVLDITFHLTSEYITHWYVDIASLDMTQVLRLDVMEHVGIVGGGIPWRRVDWDALTLEMEDAMGASCRME